MYDKLRKLLLHPENIFVVIVLIFGVMSAILVPQLANNDENMHFLRAYGLATAEPLNNTTCTFPSEVSAKARSVYSNNFTSDYSKTINTTIEVPGSCGSAAGYSPLMHLPQAVGVLIAKLAYPSTAFMVLLGRLANLAFYAIALFYIIKYVRIGKWAFFVIALFPIMVQTAGSLSADVMSNVVVLAVIAFTINLFTQSHRLTKKQAIALVMLAAIAALTKPVNAVLFLPLAFLPARLFPRVQFAKTPFNIPKWGLLTFSAIAAVGSVLTWQGIIGAPLISEVPANNPLTTNPLHFIKILFNTYINPIIGYNDIVIRGVVGEFASFRYHLPTFMLLICFGLLAFVLLYRPKSEHAQVQKGTFGKLAASNIAVLLFLVIAVSYTLYVAWAIQPYRLGPGALYADGVQGRYFTAVLALLIVPGTWASRYVSFSARSENTFRYVVTATSLFVLIFYILTTVYYFTKP